MTQMQPSFSSIIYEATVTSIQCEAQVSPTSAYLFRTSTIIIKIISQTTQLKPPFSTLYHHCTIPLFGTQVSLLPISADHNFLPPFFSNIPFVTLSAIFFRNWNTKLIFPPTPHISQRYICISNFFHYFPSLLSY